MTKKELILSILRPYFQDNSKCSFELIPNNAVSCRYRSKDGNKCAFGEMIPDDKYRSSFEGKRASSIIEECGKSIIKEEYQIFNQEEIDDIQKIHDQLSYIITNQDSYQRMNRLSPILQVLGIEYEELFQTN
jgi:hypothetical protein